MYFFYRDFYHIKRVEREFQKVDVNLFQKDDKIKVIFSGENNSFIHKQFFYNLVEKAFNFLSFPNQLVNHIFIFDYTFNFH